MEVLKSMVKYKINLKFKDSDKSLNETITEVLKVELNQKINSVYSILKKELSSDATHYFHQEESCNLKT